MTGNSLRRAWALMFGLCFGAATAQEPSFVFYVDNDYVPSEPVDRDGLTWATSFDELQDAIDKTIELCENTLETCEIRVAGEVEGNGGVYSPP